MQKKEKESKRWNPQWHWHIPKLLSFQTLLDRYPTIFQTERSFHLVDRFSWWMILGRRSLWLLIKMMIFPPTETLQSMKKNSQDITVINITIKVGSSCGSHVAEPPSISEWSVQIWREQQSNHSLKIGLFLLELFGISGLRLLFLSLPSHPVRPSSNHHILKHHGHYHHFLLLL